MKLRKMAAVLALALMLASAVPALAADARVYDWADLFSASQEAALEKQIETFQQKTGMDFVIVTSDEPHDGDSQQQIADALYDQGGFGLDEEDSGILYYIDMYERYHYLSTTGRMIDYMDDERIATAIDTCASPLSRGAYGQAAGTMISLVEGYVQRGVPEGQYRYDVVTGQRLTARHNALTSGEMLGCAAIALVAGLMFASSVKSRYKLKGNTYEYNVRDNCEVKLTGSADDYLRTTVSRARKPDPPSGGHGGRSGGGFRGGSGVHTSGGRTHGGGGGHF
ncbi:MAG: TPM domain-containing protein [Clostridiales bacterium]|nr:TPM domain-containing protein [Clostridiales bacterium]